MLNIRSCSWGAPNLSWANVIAELMNAYYELDHNIMMFSTNGLDQSMFKKKNIAASSVLELERLKKNNIPIDLDFTYTVPSNFSSRFLSNSKHKAAIYNFEYRTWTPIWKQYYGLVDYYFPSSCFSAEVFCQNGIPKEKIFVIPHGVDIELFNLNIKPIKLKTDKKFKFVSICAPHYRKKIDRMLEAYSNSFTSNDDVCLVLKTKINDKNDKTKPLYETCVGEYIKKIKQKLGNKMPEIEIIDKRVENVASIYRACNANVTTSGAEGWYMPGLESLAVGLLNIAPNYSGQLHYMNNKNSLLIDGKMVKAKREEQYWGYDAGNLSFDVDLQHTSELMIRAYKEYDTLLEKFKPEMKKTVEEYSWKNAAQKMLDVCDKKVPHYIPGTVKVPK